MVIASGIFDAPSVTATPRIQFHLAGINRKIQVTDACSKCPCLEMIRVFIDQATPALSIRVSPQGRARSAIWFGAVCHHRTPPPNIPLPSFTLKFGRAEPD